MGFTNGMVSAPVSIYDVQRALSTSKQDLGELCTHNNINKWARYKPERSSKISYLPHGTLLYQANARKGNCFGLDVPYCNSNQNKGWYSNVMAKRVYDIVEGITYSTPQQSEGKLAWQYLKPRGKSVSPNEAYRLTDFAHLPSSIDDTDYTSSSLTGYNRNAPIPFEVSVNTELTTSGVNRQVTNIVEFTYRNTYGNDLHLQDFVNLVTSDNGGYAWRPVLQVFTNTGIGGSEDWQLQSNPHVEIAGQAITNVSGASFKVSLNISDESKFPFPNNSDLTAYTYYLCLGVGYCRPSNTSDPSQPPANQGASIDWGDTTNSLFIIPYEESLLGEGIYPFFYEFKVAKYQSRRLLVTSISYFKDGYQTWDTASKSGNVFTIPSSSNPTGALRLTMTITKLFAQSLTFISRNGSWSGTDSYLKIQAREMIGYSENPTPYYMTPQTSSWQNPSTPITISRAVNSEDETATIYATITLSNFNNIPVGGYGEYHLFADTGASTMSNIGYFSIHKI